jgi:hypothetical protein
MILRQRRDSSGRTRIGDPARVRRTKCFSRSHCEVRVSSCLFGEPVAVTWIYIFIRTDIYILVISHGICTRILTSPWHPIKVGRFCCLTKELVIRPNFGSGCSFTNMACSGNNYPSTKEHYTIVRLVDHASASQITPPPRGLYLCLMDHASTSWIIPLPRE